MTDKITLAVIHGSAQFVVATFVGKVLDELVPYSHMADNVFQLSAEIILQIAGDVICTAAIMDYLSNSLPSDQYDPAGGFAYMLGLLDSQPNLRKKVGQLNALISGTLSNTLGLKMAPDNFHTFGASAAQRVPIPSENQYISGPPTNN